jgi:serine/threonine protein kinase
VSDLISTEMTTTRFWSSSRLHNTLLTELTDLSSDADNHVSSTDSGKKVPPSYDGHLASFVFLVAGLEKNLRDKSPIMFSPGTSFLDTRVTLGSGHSFVVERAEWKNRSDLGLETSSNSKWGKFVALKYVRRMDISVQANWREILLEIRALLHEPIRYHPNVVRLLGLTWAAVEGTRSVFPVLALEYAEFGTLEDLQKNSDLLPFSIKKKLCHDVSKGLSILHAAGIVHGDLKHKNVLVFRNKDQSSDIIYTAKLADFGGSVMDLVEGDQRSLHMGTRPYNAPEARGQLDAEELKLTDLYSLGLLVWQTALDGKYPFASSAFSGLTEDGIDELKASDHLLLMVKDSVRTYSTIIDEEDMKILYFAFENTIQPLPQHRYLARVIAAFQVTK